jgi:hypothetical protein
MPYSFISGHRRQHRRITLRNTPLRAGGSQAGDFTRSEVVLSSSGLFSSGASGSTVAKSFTSATNTEVSDSRYFLGGSFSSTGAFVTVSYSYANDILAESIGTFSYTLDQFGLWIPPQGRARS